MRVFADDIFDATVRSIHEFSIDRSPFVTHTIFTLIEFEFCSIHIIFIHIFERNVEKTITKPLKFRAKG